MSKTQAHEEIETRGSNSSRNVEVSNRTGFACHVSASEVLPVGPDVAFAMLTDPENYKFLHGIKVRSSRRRLVQCSRGGTVLAAQQAVLNSAKRLEPHECEIVVSVCACAAGHAQTANRVAV